MTIFKLTEQNTAEAVSKAVTVLRNGGLVIFPTETCYGIGADATNQKAVDRLFQYKTKREGKPISVIVSDKEMARKYVELGSVTESAYDKYLPGPFTIISKSLGNTAEGIASKQGTLGIRIPDYNLVTNISKEFGKPFTATSANISGAPSPYSIEKWSEQTPHECQDLVGLVLDAGDLPKNEPSTIVDTTNGLIEIRVR
ncbi:MAG: L-threonylcarbamoyladenylate synthase [Candidatus Paceibacterota bacterium]|jgi:L-threonylcarbamoyladenylate synthase